MRVSRILVPAFALLVVAACLPPLPEKPETALDNGSFDVDLDGVDIHYEVHGRGPVLMTVPNSWGLTLEGLRGMYRPLEEHLTLVYFDPRGMGGSGPVREDSDMGVAAVRADFDALRRHLGLEKVHAIGWSNGAANLIYLATDYPETLSSAIFLHGLARFGPEDEQALMERYPDLFEGYAAFQKEMEGLSVEEQNARVKAFDLEGWFPRMLADPDANRAAVAAAFEDAGFSWRHAQFAQAEMPSFDATELLPGILARSLVIAGRHDMLPPERAEEIHAALPDSQFVVFEESGHFAPIEEPEAFVRTVVEFLGVEGD